MQAGTHKKNWSYNKLSRFDRLAALKEFGVAFNDSTVADLRAKYRIKILPAEHVTKRQNFIHPGYDLSAFRLYGAYNHLYKQK